MFHRFNSCFASALLILFLIFSCKPKPNVANINYDELGEYVTAYVPSQIDISDKVRIVLAKAVDVTKHKAGDILQISPNVKGKFSWVGDDEIQFTPEGTFLPGTNYVATLRLANLYSKIPDNLQEIHFDMSTRELIVNNIIENTENINGERDKMMIVGIVESNMVTEPDWIERNFSVKHSSTNVNIVWDHSSNNKSHGYIIKNVNREKIDSELVIEFEDGNFNNNVNSKVKIPQVGKFSYTHYLRTDDSRQNLKLIFSEKVDIQQNLDGLISIEGYEGELKFSTIGNQISIIPSSTINGVSKIIVDRSIRSVFGNTLDQNVEISITFEDAHPAVKLIGNGVIVPDSKNIIIPFEAVGLDAIDVEIFKIYKNNMLQFLERYTIDSRGYNLQEVGHIVYQEKIPLKNLGGKYDQDKMERFALDLSKLTKLDKSALYQVNIGFRKAYTIYSDDDKESNIGNRDDDGQYSSFMNHRYYNYDKRKNPINDEYYNANRFVTRNLLSTNLGLIAKLGKNKKLHVSSMDIMKAQPISGVEINVYTRQKQIDEVAYTNENGSVTIDVDQNPRYIIAKHKGHVSYMSLQHNRVNSLSDFDISGKNTKKGLDGYIYGERGVWRPGDTMHLTFVLEDKLKTLPKKHPVTIKVFDTKGAKKIDRTITQHIEHLYTLSVPTHTSDPTGKWRVTAEVGGQQFTKYLRLETVKPNRLKMSYPSLSEVLDMSTNQKIELEAKWLHGSDASNLSAKVEMRISSTKTQFAEYDSYVFDDPARKIEDISSEIFSGKLDENGKASFPLKPNKDLLAPGKLDIGLKTKVFEKSGNFSEDNIKLKGNPYSSYVGVRVPMTRWGSRKIDIEKNQPVEMVALDINGKPLSNRKIKIGLYNAEWRWWYNRRNHNLYTYNSSQHLGAIDTITLRTDNQGKASWKTDINKYGSHMIRVCDEISGHCTGQLFYAGRSWHRQQGSNDKGSSLRFATDQESYNVGDIVNVTLPSSKGARLLMAVESNNKVIQESWIQTNEKETSFEIKVTEEMTPNVYIHLTMIQAYTNRKNDLPTRIYGVKAINVDNPNSKIKPEIQTVNQFRPKEPYTVSVSESKGKPMAYTLAVVDEGLLDLTRYQTPDLYKHFFAKQSLGVKTWDVYDHILNGYGTNIERRISIGGDGELKKEAATAKANRFVPVVHFSGPHYIEAGKSMEHKLNMPNYVGSVKVMVVARNSDAFGTVEKSVPVKSELMVLPTLPRVLAPGETLSLPVSVFSMHDKVKDVSVSLETSNNIELLSDNIQRLNFKKQGDLMTTFNISVGDNIGIEKFKVVATSGNFRATHEIDIEVRNPNPLRTSFEEKILQAGDEWSYDFKSMGTKGSNNGTMELSTIPAINLEQRLGYLMRYPYGCVEQTTSSVFPQLYLENFVELDKRKKKEIDENIRGGIDRLRSFQQRNGGFSYWSGNSDSNDWGTSYVGHFLIEASSLGHFVPSDMLENWKNYQTNISSNFEGLNYLAQSYRLYTLALVGSPNWSAMNRLKFKSTLKGTSSALLASAYALGGQKNVAREILDKAMLNIDFNPIEGQYCYG